MARSGAQARLAVGLGVAFLLHGALWWALAGRPLPRPAPATPEAAWVAMQTELLPSPAAAPPSPPALPPSPPRARASAPRGPPDEVAAPEAVLTGGENPASVAADGERRGEGGATQEEEMPSDSNSGALTGVLRVDDWLPAYRGQLRELLQGLRRYPVQARRDGVEGTSVVRVCIQPDGHHGCVPTVTSPSHPLLDAEALRLVREAAPFPRLPEGAAALTLEVPVAFSL